MYFLFLSFDELVRENLRLIWGGVAMEARGLVLLAEVRIPISSNPHVESFIFFATLLRVPTLSPPPLKKKSALHPSRRASIRLDARARPREDKSSGDF